MSQDASTDHNFAVVVKTFPNEATADLAAANLKSRGIECTVQADDCGGMLPGIQAGTWIRLMVREGDAEAARALLERTDDASTVPPGA